MIEDKSSATQLVKDSPGPIDFIWFSLDVWSWLLQPTPRSISVQWLSFLTFQPCLYLGLLLPHLFSLHACHKKSLGVLLARFYQVHFITFRDTHGSWVVWAVTICWRVSLSLAAPMEAKFSAPAESKVTVGIMVSPAFLLWLHLSSIPFHRQSSPFILLLFSDVPKRSTTASSSVGNVQCASLQGERDAYMQHVHNRQSFLAQVCLLTVSANDSIFRSDAH